MANLWRAYPSIPDGKQALKPQDITGDATLSVTPTPDTLGFGNNYSTLNQPIVLTTTSQTDVFPTKGFADDLSVTPTLTTDGDVFSAGILSEQVLLSITADGDRKQFITGDATGSFPLSITADGTGQNNGTLIEPIRTPFLTLTASGFCTTKGDLDTSLGFALTLTADGVATNKGDGTPQIQLTLDGQEDTRLAALVATADLTLPTVTSTLVEQEGNANNLPLPTLTSTLVQPGEMVMVDSLPLVEVSSFGAIFADGNDLPLPETSAQADTGNIATASLVAPLADLSSELIPERTAVARGDLPRFRGNATMRQNSTGIFVDELPSLEMNAVMSSGDTAVVSEVLPAWQITAELNPAGDITAELVAPIAQISSILSNSGPSTVSTFVFNTENLGASEYSNYDFLALAMFNGKPVGVSSTGIYEFSGTDDAGSPIALDVLSGISDLGTEDLKRLPNAYLGYRSDGTINFQVTIDGEPTVRTYPFTKVSHASGLKRGRATVAKGLKSRYWQVGVTNTDGADLDMDDLALYVQQFNRKVQ